MKEQVHSCLCFGVIFEMLSNYGELIQKAEEAAYDVLLSTDKNIRYPRNLSGRKIALIILGNSQWPIVQLHRDKIAKAVDATQPGSYAEIEIPFE